jgi:hypothetical protein
MALDLRLDLPDFLDRSGQRTSVPISILHKVGEAAGEFANL